MPVMRNRNGKKNGVVTNYDVQLKLREGTTPNIVNAIEDPNSDLIVDI